MYKYKKWRIIVGISLFVLLEVGCRFVVPEEVTEDDIKQEEIFYTEITECLSEEEKETISEEITEIDETQTEEESEELPIVVEDDVFVNIKTYIPDIVIELKYATTDNFTGKKIYDFTEAYLRYGTVKKLMNVQSALKEQGLSLKVWDAFRPTSAQFVLWEVCPDSTYVANPNKSFSSHSKGNTVDITIVDEKGEELIMPTAFDDFSKQADRDYSDCSKEARKNALLLEDVMKENGFKAYFGEWWHYTDQITYPVEQKFDLN